MTKTNKLEILLAIHRTMKWQMKVTDVKITEPFISKKKEGAVTYTPNE